MNELGYYILDPDNKPVLCPDVMTWARWFETANRTVARRKSGKTCVSTVFLGLDHSTGFGWDPDPKGEPVLYETMVFGHHKYEYLEFRYSSRDAAAKDNLRVARFVFDKRQFRKIRRKESRARKLSKETAVAVI